MQTDQTNVVAITLRNGRELPEVLSVIPDEVPISAQSPDCEESSLPTTPPCQPPSKGDGRSLPFPQRCNKELIEKKFSKFMTMLQGLQLTIMFTDAMREMPAYSKFLKEIL